MGLTLSDLYTQEDNQLNHPLNNMKSSLPQTQSFNHPPHQLFFPGNIRK
jgi:hypothetical protein